MTEPGRLSGSAAGELSTEAVSLAFAEVEIWLGLLRGEFSTREAADRAGVDRSTIMRVREVAKQGALDALSSSRPGVRQGGADPELLVAKAEIARLSEALEGDGRQVDAGGGKRALGLSGRVPRHVDEATKRQLLVMIDEALAGGWEHRRACRYLELNEGRAWRWRRRRDADCLEDGRPGGNPVHGLRPRR